MILMYRAWVTRRRFLFYIIYIFISFHFKKTLFRKSIIHFHIVFFILKFSMGKLLLMLLAKFSVMPQIAFLNLLKTLNLKLCLKLLNLRKINIQRNIRDTVTCSHRKSRETSSNSSALPPPCCLLGSSQMPLLMSWCCWLLLGLLCVAAPVSI